MTRLAGRVVLAAAVVLLMPAPAPHAAVAAQTAAQTAAVLEDGTFTIGGGETMAVQLGRFTVPANRRRETPAASSPVTAAPALTLRFVRFPSTSTSPAAPIVFLAGGPGDAATRAFRGMPRTWLDALRAMADVIAFDQRGTGTSEPSAITCPPTAALPLDAPGSRGALVAAMRDRLQSCLPALRSQGTDVGGLTTEESADDVEALRRALGVPAINLLAGSYGTHLAMAIARRHPSSVRAMALLGVEGPDDTLKLPAHVDAVLADIDRTMSGTATPPGLVTRARTVVARLSAEPWTKTLPNGQAVTVGAWDFQRWMSEALDAVPKIRTLGPALDTMLTGDYSDLVRWAIPFRLPRPINVMHLAMDCASFATPERLALIRAQAGASLLGDAINAPLPDVCDVAGLPRLNDAFRQPVRANMPALLISGTFDGRTPPVNAERAAASLPRARLLTIPGASHALFQEPAALAAITGWFRTGAGGTGASLEGPALTREGPVLTLEGPALRWRDRD